MVFQQPELPFGFDELEPHISARTLEFHYGKHHKAYINTTNSLIKETDFENKSLEDIIRLTANDAERATLFNNAAQAWNHAFFWHSLSPKGGRSIEDGAFKDVFERSFGDMESFKASFKKAAVSLFGSGWVWLIADNDGLKIVQTKNGDTPIAHGQKPLLTLDVWEHAYYLDYQNRRPDFADAFLDNLINWRFAEENFAAR